MPQTWNWPYHTVETRYPMNSTVVQFGNGYSFTSKPTSPPQRTFVLDLSALRIVTDSSGNVIEGSNPQLSVYSLDLFYRQVQCYEAFTYNHPMYGALLCRFAKPLVLPKVEPGGGGVVPNITVELIEVP